MEGGSLDRCRLLVYRIDLVRESGDNDRTGAQQYALWDRAKQRAGVYRLSADRCTRRSDARKMAANRDRGDSSSQLKGHFGPPECRS
jgi:hypothetical protein